MKRMHVFNNDYEMVTYIQDNMDKIKEDEELFEVKHKDGNKVHKLVKRDLLGCPVFRLEEVDKNEIKYEAKVYPEEEFSKMISEKEQDAKDITFVGDIHQVVKVLLSKYKSDAPNWCNAGTTIKVLNGTKIQLFKITQDYKLSYIRDVEDLVVNNEYEEDQDLNEVDMNEEEMDEDEIEEFIGDLKSDTEIELGDVVKHLLTLRNEYFSKYAKDMELNTRDIIMSLNYVLYCFKEECQFHLSRIDKQLIGLEMNYGRSPIELYITAEKKEKLMNEKRELYKIRELLAENGIE